MNTKFLNKLIFWEIGNHNKLYDYENDKKYRQKPKN